MKRNNTESLSDVLQQVLKENKLDKKLYEFRLMRAWRETLGDYINKYTVHLEVKNKVLYVKLSSAALRSELFMNRTLLCQKLNDAVGQQVVTDIKFL